MTDLQLGRAIIVGGSGMLANASAHVARRATDLMIVSRTPQMASETLGARAVVVDWRDLPNAIATVGRLPEADFLLSWLHDDGVWLVEHLEARLIAGGRSIRVHGANSRDPAARAKRDPNPRSDIERQTVILGWMNGGTGRRWLTNEEISDAVIQAIATPNRGTVVAGTLTGDPPGV